MSPINVSRATRPLHVPQAPAAVQVFANHQYAPAQRPRPSLDPDHPIQAHQHRFWDDGHVKASGQSVWEHDNPFSLADSLILETGDGADRIHISQPRPGQLNVLINDRLYVFASQDNDGDPLTFHFKTHGGDDRVVVDANVTQPLIIDAGAGNDRVQAGAGYTRLFGGDGDDVLCLGSGVGYAEGNEGDDVILGGSGDSVLYGNNGNDRLYAGAGAATKHSYLDGGNGDDRLYAGHGHTVLHGGAGDDQLVGHDRSIFYTGRGRDRVIGNGPGDLIYAKPGDALDLHRGSRVTPASPDTRSLRGFAIQGSPAFKQRVEDDLQLLRSSPQGQRMLGEMHAAAQRNGAPVTIVEDEFDAGSGYSYGSQALKARLGYARASVVGDDPNWGFMVNGVPGARADRAEIAYNRSQLNRLAGRTYAPLTVLYHEMAHAYNGANGTSLTGSTLEDQNGTPVDVHNSERQAVGLESSAAPFDFDNDPATPPTTTNPEPFTENALNQEMGEPLRQHYVD